MPDTEKLNSHEGRLAATALVLRASHSPPKLASIVELFLNTAQQLIQCREPIERADLVADAFSSQEVAYPSTRSDDTQRYAPARKVEVQLVQHARAREIDMG